MFRSAAVLLALVTACNFDPAGGAIRDGGLPSDAADIDAEVPPDAARVPAVHILLSEVRGVAGATGGEFIEIFNPLDVAVPLDRYFLTDAGNYFRLPAAVATAGELDIDPTADFLVRFPSGAVLEPGAAAVIALNGGEFEAEFGAPAEYSLAGEGANLVLLYGSAGATLTDNGELVALFRWDGLADLVTDVDQVVAGNNPAALNLPVDKSGELVDGPDEDGAPTAYLAEAFALTPTARQTKASESYKRVALEGTAETATGGNGIDGHDETSENTASTWMQMMFTAPDPGSVAVPLTQ
jgi:uncharacterized protein